MITQLDGLYLKDENQRIYTAYEEFETYSRPEGMSIDNFISDFDRLYNKVKAHKIELPDAVRAYRVLKSANLSQSKVELVRATLPEMTYKEMIKQLRKLEDMVVSKTDSKVKEEAEDAMYGRDYGRGGRSRGRARGNRGSRGRGRGSERYNWRSSSSSGRKWANPTDESGQSTKCFICKSMYHWAKDCPNQTEEGQNHDSYYEEEVHVTLFAKGLSEQSTSQLLGETIGCAVLDSGCSRNVCSDKWLHCFIQSLDEEEQNQIKYKDSNKKFRFGDNSVHHSMTTATIPITIGNKRILMDTDVIGNDIPLLLSKPAMKQLATKMDFETDKVTMMGNKIDLKFASSGHYVIPLNKKTRIAQSLNEKPIKVFLANAEKIQQANTDGKEKMCMKIHRQFSHAHGNKLAKLVKDAGVKDQEFVRKIQSIQDRCNICIQYKKPPPKPIVCVPLANQFNESIAMDLKEINGHLILHIIDHATRYSQACAVPSKKTKVIISAVLQNWVALFGSPMRILTDNGGEFSSEQFREMGEKLSTRIVTTAAESPWSNGINERHNAILGNMVLKVMEDTKCKLEDAIVWAVAAKNSLANVYGYSPCQLVFGKNPGYPSVLHDKMPALSSETKSEMLSDKLNALHSARKAFVTAESDERIRRALRQKTRNYSTSIYQNGDSVFYKRENVPAWKGPGVVIGQDGQTILVKHGSTYVRVHPSRITHEYAEVNSNQSEMDTSKEPQNSRGSSIRQSVDEEEIDVDKNQTEIEQNHAETPQNHAVVTHNHAAVSQAQVETPTEVSRQASISQSNADPNAGQIFMQSGRELPKVHKHVVAKLKNDEWKQFKILSRAGKIGSKHENWLNVHDKDEDRAFSMDWKDNIQEWKEAEPEEVLVAYAASQDQMSAMFAEMNKWREYDVYEEVEDVGQHAISTRWVFTSKDGITKARLVARGFEDSETNLRTDSPTCSKMNLRIIMAIAASKKWKINSLDIQAAYLQGKIVERDIFLKPPVEANTNCLWKLKKCVYGLNEAARMWYLRLSTELINLGMKKSKYDEAIFYWHRHGKLQGVLSAHVDDFFWAGTKMFKEEILEKLTKTFKISSESQDSFKYLGIQVKQDGNKIILNQEAYAKDLKPIVKEDNPDPTREVTKAERLALRQTTGQLMWLANQSRPDVAFDACYLSNSIAKAKVAEITRANKAIRKVQMENNNLLFNQVENIESSTLKVFADASFKSLPGGASQGGFIILLADKQGNVCPLQWKSKKIKRVVKSTLAAECLALQEASETAFYLKTILAEILGVGVEQIKIECYTDNKSLKESLHSTRTLEEKRLILDEAILKDMIQKGEIHKVHWIESQLQIADPLTKGTASSQRMLEVLGQGSLKTLLKE